MNTCVTVFFLAVGLSVGEFDKSFSNVDTVGQSHLNYVIVPQSTLWTTEHFTSLEPWSYAWNLIAGQLLTMRTMAATVDLEALATLLMNSTGHNPTAI